MIDVAMPGGVHNRWGWDEPKPEDAPSGLTFSTTMPGGFEQLSCTLARQPGRNYPDLAEFSTLTAYGAGGETAWQGRLQSSPRTSGDQMAITPGAVGWQAALDDDQSARMIYIDIDMTRWQAPSVGRQLYVLGFSIDLESGSVQPDSTSGNPSVATLMQGIWSRSHASECWYDAHGMGINAVWYAWKIPSTVSGSDPNWNWSVSASDDDAGAVSVESSGNLRAAGPGMAGFYPTAQSHPWAMVQAWYSTGPTGASGTNYGVYWTNLSVFGHHNVPLRGTPGSTPGGCGYYASDIAQSAVGAWAPNLATSRNGVSTIESTTFIIPHLVFLDPTTAGNMVKQVTRYELPDWWVDEGPTFNLASRENHGRDWRARVGPSGLSETGPQVDRLFNSVIVSYNDVTGVTRTVGPTGSFANTIDDSLNDSDPSNPVTAAGLKRRSLLAMGIVSTPAAAIAVGQGWLAEQKLLSTAGQATIVGTVQDNHGITCPAWQIRAGDRITFTDAHDPSSRRIVKTSYNDATRTCTIDLDSPPEGLSALLARLSVSLTPLGL